MGVKLTLPEKTAFTGYWDTGKSRNEIVFNKVCTFESKWAIGDLI